MCLSLIYLKRRRDKIVKKITKKGGWITVWKVVKPGLRSDILDFRFNRGINISSLSVAIPAMMSFYGYAPYFHSWRTRAGAREWRESELNEKVIKCKVRPSWITAIGGQRKYDVIVSRKIII